MALVLKDRIKESTVSTGTGTITLGGATGAYQTFAAIGDGNVTYYAIYGQTTNEWEVGYGTYTASGTTLSRDYVYSSSNSGSLVNFSAGTKDVICTYPAEQAVFQETNGNLKLIQGVIEVSEDGTSGTTLPNTAYQAFATGNYYMQANLQNLSSGANASADWVVTADNGTDTVNYTDLGMASSGYNYTGFSAIKANSTYLLGTGSDVRIIAGKYGAVTPGAQDIVFVAGSLEDTEERARIKGDTGNIILSSTANPTDTGEKLQVVGTAKITGATTFGSTVTLNADPSANLQAATKQYVDNVASLGIIIHPAVRVESIGNLNATYNNGTAGVGATLTNAGTQAALELDGITLNVNDRVLVGEQTTQTQNGVYTVTDIGSGSTNWVLTRATDADTYGVTNPAKLAQGSYFYIQEGDTAAGESYTCTTVGAIVFGTTAITFSQFSASPAYTGTSPINVSGQIISLTGVVDELHGGTGLSAYTAGDLIYSNTTNNLTNLAIGSTGQTLIVSGGAPVWGALDLAGSGVSGVLPETHGGTNQSSYATGDMLYASATNTLAKLSPNTSTTKKWLNQTGTGSAGQAPTWDVITASDIASGVLGVANGGTGLSSYAVGDIIYASGATTLSVLAGVATGNALISGGLTTAPSWGKIGLTTHVSGTLPVANGGTGVTTSTGSGNVVLSTSPTLVTPILGTPQSGDFSTGTFTWPTFNQNTSGSAATFTSTTQNSQFNSVGVGTAGSGTAGEIRATNNITAYYSSDIRFKENIKTIEAATDKVLAIGGKEFDWTADYIADHGGADGYFVQKEDFGVIAQDVQKVFPKAVRTRDDGSLAVDYSKLVALAFASIVELKAEIEELKKAK